MFRNLRREKELVDQEVEIYRKEQKLLADSEMVEYRKQILILSKKCADDTAKHEHEYHSKMEQLGINVAKLEAKEEYLEASKEMWEKQKQLILSSTDRYKELLAAKDSEIERLSDLLDSMIENIPQFPEVIAVSKR